MHGPSETSAKGWVTVTIMTISLAGLIGMMNTTI
jgi:hypothetical protein